MSRRRMILIGLTVVSALAFIIDHFVFSAPSAAEAASSAHKKPVRKSAPVEVKSTDDNPTTDPSLAYLDRLSNPTGGRDVLSMSSEMILYYKALQERQEAQQQGPRPGSPDKFKAKHVLEGTNVGPGGPLAVINGEVVRPKDIIDDFRVIGINAYAVELRHGRDHVTLTLPKPDSRSKENRAAKKPPIKPSR